MKAALIALVALPGSVLAGNFSSFDDSRQALIEDPLRVEFSGGTVAQEKMRQAVASGAATKGWQVVKESEGIAELTTNVRGQHMVRLEVRYDPTGFDLAYRESVNLLYVEKRSEGYVLRGIHQNYNKWIRDLSSAISFATGQPAGIVGARTRTEMVSATNFAPSSDVDAVPYLKERGRDGYKWYLKKEVPSAFAIAPNGAWAWANRGGDPIQRALNTCNRSGYGTCKLYSVDKTVVWSRE